MTDTVQAPQAGLITSLVCGSLQRLNAQIESLEDTRANIVDLFIDAGTSYARQHRPVARDPRHCTTCRLTTTGYIRDGQMYFGSDCTYCGTGAGDMPVPLDFIEEFLLALRQQGHPLLTDDRHET